MSSKRSGFRSGTVRFKNHTKNVQCPACLDRNALNIVGQPAFVDGARLSAGCEVCGGKGRIDQAERIDGWPRPELWTVFREDTPKRRAYRTGALEPGPGIRAQRQ